MTLIILDRDGVINQDSPDYIKSPDEWVALPGSLEAIAKFTRAQCRVVVATNQSGIGRGLYDIDTLNQIHLKMVDAVKQAGGEIEAVFFCPHTPEDNCLCRKPKPGLLFDIAHRLGEHLEQAYVIGDSLRDIQAAIAAKSNPILVLTGNGQQTLDDNPELVRAIPYYTDLNACADAIIEYLQNP